MGKRSLGINSNQLLRPLPPTKEVPHTCKIVNYFADLLLVGGQIVGGRGCGKGQGGGGQEGWGKGGGVRMGARGWNLYLNEILNKTGIVTGLGNRNEIGESPILEGFPHCNDITFLENTS